MVSLLWLLACGEPDATVPLVDAEAVFARASVALRGRLPTEAELDRLQADPDALDAMLDGIVDDPAFGARVADLVAPIWRTRVDRLSYLLGDRLTERSLGDEPLQMIARIAQEDLPYTEVVTGDWTMADARMAAVWPVSYPPGGEGWQVSAYTDGRPAAGVLSTNALWWRYRSTAENLNRGRANAIARILLCSDFTERPVHFERTVDVFDTEALMAETRANPACANCHSTLDPIGSYLFGFWYFNEAGESPTYNPGTERLWTAGTQMAPSFYGDPGYRLEDLGAQIAGDPRFVTCAVESVWEGLLRRDARVDDLDALTRHREAFLDGGLTLRTLIRSMLDDPAFQSVGGGAASDTNLQLMTPGTLAKVIEDLTGFVWTWEGIGLLVDDEVGVRTLAGGVDGFEVTREADRPNATTMLVLERVAEAASLWAVTHDAERPEGERLFTEVDFTERPGGAGDARMREQLRRLFRRTLGRAVATDGEEVGLTLALWQEAYQLEGDPARAWAVVLAYLIRDPDFATL